ncbi:MAG: DUF6463 family protein [Propionibacteriaceae bacterium]
MSLSQQTPALDQTAPRTRPRAVVGPVLLGIGVIHLAFTPFFQPAFGSLVVAGLTRTPATSTLLRYAQESGFWYVVCGVGVLLLGGLAWWIERQVPALPTGLGVALVVLSLCGLLLGPVTGFWLFLVPAALVLVRRQQVRSRAATNG